MPTDTAYDTHTVEALDLDWEVPCRPYRHKCTRPAEWAYEHTSSCGCYWEIFYCSPCRKKQLALLAAVPPMWLCRQCHAACTSITSKWWPLHDH